MSADAKPSCVVVGNGPSLRGSGMGGIIDSYDVVVRLNNYVVEGCEGDVGSKTDVWATTFWGDIDRSKLDTTDAAELLLLTSNAPTAPSASVRRWAESKCEELSLVYSVVSQTSLQRGLKELGGNSPSSGVMTLMHYIEKYGEVAAVGFDFFEGDGHHYFDESRRPSHCPHKGNLERTWFESASAAGRIRLLHNTSDLGFVVVSGYTRGTAYADEVKHLEASLEQFGVPFKTYPYDSCGDWTRNTMVKARLVKLAMIEFPGDVVIWVDADAVITTRPDFFFDLPSCDFDICCHYLSSPYNKSELLTGTIAFNGASELARHIADEWVSSPEVDWDQRILQRVIRKSSGANVMRMPSDYIKIRPVGHPSHISQGVVFHKQLSRDQKAKVSQNNSLTVKSSFQRIYKTKGWTATDSASGPGSSLLQTERLREMLPKVIRELGVRSLLDLPCGDMNWMSEVDLRGVDYTGADIVPELIARNRERYKDMNFVELDGIVDPLPAHDMVLTRDMLVHLPFSGVWSFLKNVKKSGSKYIALTSFQGRARNADCGVGSWRTLNMQVAPFLFPDPVKTIAEHCTEAGGRYADKSLLIWDVDDLPI